MSRRNALSALSALSAVAGLATLAPGLAAANDRAFAYTYESATLPNSRSNLSRNRP